MIKMNTVIISVILVGASTFKVKTAIKKAADPEKYKNSLSGTLFQYCLLTKNRTGNAIINKITVNFKLLPAIMVTTFS
jgi:hypothetical protein